jgi:hypothetical protein
VFSRADNKALLTPILERLHTDTILISHPPLLAAGNERRIKLETFNEALREKSDSQLRFTAPTLAITLLFEPRWPALNSFANPGGEHAAVPNNSIQVWSLVDEPRNLSAVY